MNENENENGFIRTKYMSISYRKHTKNEKKKKTTADNTDKR